MRSDVNLGVLTIIVKNRRCANSCIKKIQNLIPWRPMSKTV